MQRRTNRTHHVPLGLGVGSCRATRGGVGEALKGSALCLLLRIKRRSGSKLRRHGRGEGSAQDRTRAAGELCVREMVIKLVRTHALRGLGVRSRAVRVRREKPPEAARTGVSPTPFQTAFQTGLVVLAVQGRLPHTPLAVAECSP